MMMHTGGTGVAAAYTATEYESGNWTETGGHFSTFFSLDFVPQVE